MKIWIVGSKGLLGSSLVECCKKKGIEAVGTDRQEADICNQGQLRTKAMELNPTHIVNCAAYTDVDGAEKDSATAFAVNAEGAAHVAQVAKECGARLVHISTDYVFNGLGSVPYREEGVCEPINVYGKSKWKRRRGWQRF